MAPALTDVRCRLFDAGGKLAAESSGFGDDWNCALAEPIAAGDYAYIATAYAGTTAVGARSAGEDTIIDPKNHITIFADEAADDMDDVDDVDDEPQAAAPRVNRAVAVARRLIRGRCFIRSLLRCSAHPGRPSRGPSPLLGTVPFPVHPHYWPKG